MHSWMIYCDLDLCGFTSRLIVCSDTEDNSADVKVLMTGSSVLRGSYSQLLIKKIEKSLRGALVAHTQYICSVMHSCSDLQVKAM